jgi:hypothetical protein
MLLANRTIVREKKTGGLVTSLRRPEFLDRLVAQSATRFGVGGHPPAPKPTTYGRGEACGFLGPLRIVLVDIAKHAPLGQSDLIPPLAYAAMSQT